MIKNIQKVSLLSFIVFGSIGAQQPLNIIALFDPHAVELPSTQRFALMSDLVAALEQKAAPIFISPSLWNNFISRRNRYDPEKGMLKAENHFLLVDLAQRFGRELVGQPWPNMDISNFVSKIQKLYKEHYTLYNELLALLNELHRNKQLLQERFLFLQDVAAKKIFTTFNTKNISPQLAPKHEIRQEIDLDFICYKTKFNEQEWIIKKVEEHLIVLVPKVYKETVWNNTTLESFNLMGFLQKPNKDSLSKFENAGKTPGRLTAQELALGIKIDHLTDFYNPLEPQNKEWKAAQINSEYSLFDILVNKKDLGLIQDVKKPEQKLPENLKYEQLLHPLFLYLSGHGAIEKITFLQEREKEAGELLKQLDYYQKQEEKFKKEKEAISILVDLQLWRELDRQEYSAKNKAKKINEDLDSIKQTIEKFVQKAEELHGFIAGLTRDEFIGLLYFLELMVPTKFFFYNTCFGGGKQLETAYILINEYELDKKIKQIARNFNYTIACGALADASISSAPSFIGLPPFGEEIDTNTIPYKIENNQISLEVKHQQNFVKFFIDLSNYFGIEKIKEKKDEHLGKIINYIHPFNFLGIIKSPHFIYNIPQVRFPHTEWFRVVDVQQYVARLTDFSVNLLKAKNKNSLILDDKQLVLLYPNVIPIKLEIQKKFPAFISMKGGATRHVIKELNAEAFNFSEVIKEFFSLDYAYNKIFAIQSVTSKLDLTPLPKDRATIKNVVFVYKSKELVDHKNLLKNAIYFEDNKFFYVAYWSAFDKKIPLKKDMLPQFTLLHEYDSLEKQKIDQFRNFAKIVPLSAEPEKGIVEKALGEYELSDVAKTLNNSQARKIIAEYTKLTSEINSAETDTERRVKITNFDDWKKTLNPKQLKVLTIIEKLKLSTQELSDAFNNLGMKLKKLNDILKH